MREVDLLLVLVPLVEREVDDPGEREAVLVDELELSPDSVARTSRELVEVGRIAGGEEHRVADLEAHLLLDRSGALRPDVLGDRARAAFLALSPEDVGHARLALVLRPRVHAVAERA